MFADRFVSSDLNMSETTIDITLYEQLLNIQRSQGARATGEVEARHFITSRSIHDLTSRAQYNPRQTSVSSGEYSRQLRFQRDRCRFGCRESVAENPAGSKAPALAKLPIAGVELPITGQKSSYVST